MIAQDPVLSQKCPRITASTCSIGVVTYLGRFETYFQPLIRRLHFLFPDYEINVFINGHYDLFKQLRYLQRVTAFLQQYPNVRYFTHISHQPLARGWNWLILMSTRNRALILNDDVFPELDFRYNLERLENTPPIFTINHSFSHFVIAKAVIRRIGWFDERFLGIGHEDGDYICRLAFQGITVATILLKGLINYVAPATEAGWAELSDVVHEKYSRVNFEIFKKKWWHSNYGPVPEGGSLKIPYGGLEWTVAPNDALEPMPNFYPLESLDFQETGGEKFPQRKNYLVFVAQLSSFIHYLARSARNSLSAVLRTSLGRRRYSLGKKKRL